MQNQLKVIDKKVKTYIIFDRVHKTKVEVLKFMGKTLYLECYSGISGVNTLTQDMINEPNTIYILQYDYCLAGQTIELPDNSIILWRGRYEYI